MTKDISEKEMLPVNETNRMKTARWLIRGKAKAGFRSIHFWIILALFAVFTFAYYTVLTQFYDIYLVIFFYPLIYAAIVYRLRGVLIVSLLILGILLPLMLILTYDAYSLLRTLLFTHFVILISALGAVLLNYLERQLGAYDEIMSLNNELNSYIERLEKTQKQLIHSEKLNAIGQLAASVAHEINNPLTGVLVYAKLLVKKLEKGPLDREEGMETLHKITSAVEHCSHIIKGLLDFSRQSEPELKKVRLEGVIREVVALIGHQAEMNRVKVSVLEVSPLPEVTADGKQLRQVFVNLAVNAIQAMPEGGELTIRGAVEDGWLKVSVRDNGPGISPGNVEKLFTPFFTTKEQGTGLGLAVSYGIIERHGGKIEVESKPGEGSTFTVYLPVKTPRPG